MPIKAGPIGNNPFEMAPHTPGSLGVNDAASPGAPVALLGNTPGSLGVNDHAAPIGNANRTPDGHPKGGWSAFLDSVCDWDSLYISGAPIAFDWPGHRDMTDKSVADFRTHDLDGFLPPAKSGVRQRLLAVLSDLSGEGGFGEVQWTDITLRQYTDDREQSTHFMAVRGQSLPDAYKAGMAKIFGPVDEAISLFQNPVSDVKKIATKLGNGIHPLQDSFSETHCKREARDDRSVIVGIFVWDQQDKKEHKAGDEKWQNSGGGLSAIGNTVVDATRMILAYFVLGALGKREDAANKKFDLIEKYFVASGPVAGR